MPIANYLSGNWTEVDADGDITVTSNTITVDTLRRDADSYVYGDYGADHFNDFKHTLGAKVVVGDISGVVGLWGIGNTPQSGRQADLAGDGFNVEFLSGAVYRVYLNDWTTPASVFCDITINTDYWFIISRRGATLTCHIYSDSGFSTLVNSLSLTVPTTAYRYVYGMQGLNNPFAPAATITGVMWNLNLKPTKFNVIHSNEQNLNASRQTNEQHLHTISETNEQRLSGKQTNEQRLQGTRTNEQRLNAKQTNE
jgi:hypothetical protein